MLARQSRFHNAVTRNSPGWRMPMHCPRRWRQLSSQARGRRQEGSRPSLHQHSASRQTLEETSAHQPPANCTALSAAMIRVSICCGVRTVWLVAHGAPGAPQRSTIVRPPALDGAVILCQAVRCVINTCALILPSNMHALTQACDVSPDIDFPRPHAPALGWF